MQRKAILCFVLLTLVIPASLFAERMTDNWRLTGYTRYRDAVFADRDRISEPEPGITAVWIKIAPSQRSKYLLSVNDYLATVKKRNKGFKSIEILCEINCSSHWIRFTRFIYLDNKRNIIHKAYDARPEWFLISQGNIWYPVEKEACRKNK